MAKKVIVDPNVSQARSVPFPLPCEPTTIGDAILCSVNRNSEKIAVISDHEQIAKSFRQLFDESFSLAENLVRICGLKHGDHVAIATGNCYNYLVAFLASAIKGLVVWQYDANMAPSELERLLAIKRPEAVFTMGLGSRQHACFPNMAANLMKLRGMRTKIIAIDGQPYEWTDSYHIDELMAQHNDHQSQDQLTSPEDPLLVLMTSGSTGTPKGVMWSHRNVVAFDQYLQSYCNFTDNHKLCLPLSVHHALGSTILRSVLYHGHTLILTGYKYSLTQTIACLVKYDCNYIALVSAMLHDVLLQASNIQINLTDILLGGAVLSQQMASRMMTIFPDIMCHQFYGLSETHCTGIATQDRFDTVGKPMADCLVKVVNDNGHIVPHEEEGRLFIKTNLGMLGYLTPGGALDTAFRTADGFFDTGDLFKMDAQGYLYYQGRRKDIINRGGYKISPKEVENVVLSVTGILDCLVISIPDQRLGEEIVAVVQVEKNSDLSSEKIQAYLSAKMSRSKAPRHVHVSSEPWPRLPGLKFDKIKLRSLVSQLYDQRA